MIEYCWEFVEMKGCESGLPIEDVKGNCNNVNEISDLNEFAKKFAHFERKLLENCENCIFYNFLKEMKNDPRD